MQHPSHYSGRKVVVLGLAKSGQAVAQVLRRYGANVIANDRKPREESPEADALEQLGIEVVCGGHPDGLIDRDTALLVKNPGIPYRIEPIRDAERLGVEIVTEVEVAYHLSEAPIIGITGSNGKTTTTTWVGEMLEAGKLRPIVAGNIGRPLCEAAEEADDDNWLVVELSSFQLKGTSAFRPRIACLLNVAETHLDYHGTMEDYQKAKAKLFANQRLEDTAVLNWDDAFCRELAAGLTASILPFSARQPLEYGFCLKPDADGRETIVRIGRGGELDWICPTEELGIRGRHNVENALAASAIAWAAGVSAAAIGETLRAFRGVEHRLERVADKNGVSFYNDSKATNPQATLKALDAFSGNVIWIGGGLDRGSDYAELTDAFADKVKAVVAIGETRGKLAKVARDAGIDAVVVVDTGKEHAQQALEQAVREAVAFASQGDVVLLSPACASWDMFPSYEVRGRIFKNAVHNL